jgi:3-phosphoshikimate 1-carboxyvinyltransferase
MPPDTPEPLALAADGPLSGRVEVPGDKSISHRALMLGALAVGRTEISGLLEGEDVVRTADALAAMGAGIERRGPGDWWVHGVGVGALLAPVHALDMGNSGTSCRLLMGLLASHPIEATFVGDASLASRPMARVIAPLAAMGADIRATRGDRLPLMVRGLAPALPLDWVLRVPSAQVKSAILLAGLNARGETRVLEPVQTRDHSERMLRAFGADVRIEDTPQGRLIAVRGEAELRPQRLRVPGDISSAAFPLVAALLVRHSHVTLSGVGVNPTRDGLLRVLAAMGADIEAANPRDVGGEPVADLVVRAGPLRGVSPDPAIAPSMIDEFPVLFAAAALAEGRSVFRGLQELRVKESDRLHTMAAMLRAAGARVEELADGLVVEGSGGDPLPGGATIDPGLDHRIAMSACVLSLACRVPLVVSDMRPAATSFPGFVALMRELGAVWQPPA